MKSKDYKEDVCFGIAFDSYQYGNYEYSIFYNTTGIKSEIP